MKRILSVALLSLLVSCSAFAELKLPGIFSDHMVLQADAEIPVWGSSDPGEEISVQLGDEKKSGKADEHGKWLVKLAKRQAAAKPIEMLVTDSKGKSLRREDVLIGEVWIGSGQSNMAFAVQREEGADEVIKASGNDKIRLFTAAHVIAQEPKDDTDGKWVLAEPETVKTFSAALYHFGKEINEKLNVPVGLIHSSWGGTPIQVWMPTDAFGREDLKAEKEKAAAAKRAAAASTKPTGPRGPAVLFNGMIAPLAPYAIRGVTWYQGEANTRAENNNYAELMTGMVKSWRKVFDQGDWTFLYVQIAPYGKYTAPDSLPTMWLEQTKALSMIPNSGMAGTGDIGTPTDIHPKLKQQVGHRLALLALAKTYGKSDVVCEGPMYKSHSIDGDKVKVKFSGVGGGLVARDEKELTLFEIAGADGKFVPAKATIEGDSVVVSSDEVKSPTAVRFSWNATEVPNLTNKEGLPAIAFRTNQ